MKPPQDEPSNWDRVHRRVKADCRIYKVWEDHYRHPRNGNAGDFYAIDAPDWVMILGITREGKMIRVRQFRFGVDDLTWELPAGMINAGEDPVKAGVRELQEETGYGNGRARLLVTMRPNPALMNNRMHIVLVEDLERVGEVDPDEHEEITVDLLSPAEMMKEIREGRLDHALVAAAFYHWLMDRGFVDLEKL
ncbi:MAG: NUDIX hydrolase [Opitutales bacterium]|nr:NUDIX hydrolase [Opitutales bacterium]